MELKREEGMGGDISELKSLISGELMVRNSARNPQISGSLADRIAKTLIYDKRRKPGTDLEIVEIKKALIDFANQLRSGNIGRDTI